MTGQSGGAGTSPRNRKFGLLLKGGGAVGAYAVGAAGYLCGRGMECVIVTGASAGAVNAAVLAGATRYPPRVLRKLWEKLAVDGPIPFLPEIRAVQEAAGAGLSDGKPERERSDRRLT